MLLVGKTLKTHGLKGELKVQSFLDSPSLFRQISSVQINNTEYAIRSARVQGDYALMTFVGIDTVEKAQPLVGADIYCSKVNMPSLPEGRYYISDIVGCDAFIGEEKIGKIKDILQYGSADVIVMKKEGQSILCPWLKELFVSVDTDNKKIQLNRKVFDEVAVYED